MVEVLCGLFHQAGAKRIVLAADAGPTAALKANASTSACCAFIVAVFIRSAIT